VLKPLGNYFIPCCVCLVGYIQPSWIFSSGNRGVAALLGQTYPTLSRIYLTTQIYPSSIRLQSRGSCPGRTYQTPGWIYPTHQIYSGFIGFQYHVTPTQLDISEPHRIYLTQPKLSHFEFPIGHIRSRSDRSDVLIPPMVINVWGL
jgi:hypothetical protein